MDVYGELREVLHKNAIGAPKSDAFDEILRLLFTPQEAAVARKMTFAPMSAQQIADATGMPSEEIANICESMAKKGVLFSRDKKGVTGYALLPTVPGLFEFPLMRGITSPFHEKLAALWNKYHDESLGHELGGAKTPVMRVIPVEQTIQTRNKVLHYDVVSKMLETPEYFAVAQCACRVSVGACDKPRDTCLMFDSAARFLVDRGIAKEIHRDDAQATLLRAEEAALVHMCNNSQDRLTVICNCCSCCCTMLTVMTRLHNPNAFARSPWHASVAADACTGCAVCSDERCPVGAITLSDEIAQVDENRCVGCVLCVSTCSGDAITMIHRRDPLAPPSTVQEMGMNVLMEKGRLEQYLALHKR